MKNILLASLMLLSLSWPTQSLPAATSTQMTRISQPLQLPQAIRQLTDNLSAQQSRAELELQLQTIEQQWQQLFSQHSSLALNKLYNSFQVQSQLLRQQSSEAMDAERLAHHKTRLSQLRQQIIYQLTMQQY